MRAFITLEFERDIKEKISAIQGLIRQRSEKGRFKYIDNFHITLKFLGETDLNTLSAINYDLIEKLKGQQQFELSIKEIGAFGVGSIVRTIYLALSGQTDELQAVYNVLNKVCEKHGFKFEGRFSPHVTVAQEVKLISSYDSLKKEIKVEGMDNIRFDRITIMKSEQISGKRIYTPVYTINL